MSAGTYLGVRVTRSSKRRNRRAATAFLLLAAVALMTIAIVKIRQDAILTGLELGAWAFVPLALIIGFTYPVQCRVMTTRGTACGNEAYGLLFGCNKAGGHAFNKLRARLHLQSNAETPIRHAKPTADVAMMYHVAPEQAPLKVIDDSLLSRCGVWAGIVSAAAGVAAVILTVAFH